MFTIINNNNKFIIVYFFIGIFLAYNINIKLNYSSILEFTIKIV